MKSFIEKLKEEKLQNENNVRYCKTDEKLRNKQRNYINGASFNNYNNDNFSEYFN